MSLSPVFLSASLPDPRRDPKYFATGNTVAIRDAVVALTTVVLPRTRLVFGGHPAITPMVKWVAEQLGHFDRLRMFQSKFFREHYLADVEVFKYEEVEAVWAESRAEMRAKSLTKMRTEMLLSESFSAAVFVGGMEGVEEEYDLAKELRELRDVPRFPVATTGAAAARLWSREQGELFAVPPWQQDRRRHQLDALASRTAYAALFTELLDSRGERR